MDHGDWAIIRKIEAINCLPCTESCCLGFGKGKRYLQLQYTENIPISYALSINIFINLIG